MIICQKKIMLNEKIEYFQVEKILTGVIILLNLFIITFRFIYNFPVTKLEI